MGLKECYRAGFSTSYNSLPRAARCDARGQAGCCMI